METEERPGLRRWDNVGIKELIAMMVGSRQAPP